MNAQQPKRGQHLVTAARMMPGGGGVVSRIFAGPGHRLLDAIDSRLESGSIEAWLPDGTMRILGGRTAGFHCKVQVRHWRALARLAISGSVGWFRAWEAGEWDSPDPVPLFALFMANARSLGNVARARGMARLWSGAVHWLRRNSRSGSKRNIAFHYDLGNDFYSLWLDEKLHYSSALFEDIQQSLEDGQDVKTAAILDRLNLRDGSKLLEIGCGWGAVAEAALDRAHIDYVGLTLSEEQRAHCLKRLARFGEHARVEITDYRDATGEFDAIASIEMVEAVGQEYWPDYLRVIHDRLKPGGCAAIQYICIDDAIFESYARNVDFIQTYIFPGGMLLSESRFRELAEAQGLEWRDVRHFGQDYARTLRIWRERFDTAVDAGALPPSFDRRFVELWQIGRAHV